LISANQITTQQKSSAPIEVKRAADGYIIERKGKNTMTRREEYESKFISIDEALALIRDGDTIAVGHYGNEPRNLMRHLHTLKGRVKDVTVWANNPSLDYGNDLLLGYLLYKDETSTLKRPKRRCHHSTAARSYSVVQWVIVGHLPEICLGIAVEDQIRIPDRVIIDQVVKLRSLKHTGRDRILYCDGVDGEHRAVQELQLDAGCVHVEFAG